MSGEPDPERAPASREPATGTRVGGLVRGSTTLVVLRDVVAPVGVDVVTARTASDRTSRAAHARLLRVQVMVTVPSAVLVFRAAQIRVAVAAWAV